jgi:hypothetical protein
MDIRKIIFMKKKTLFWIIVLFILILYVGIVGYLSYKGGYFVDNTINDILPSINA